MFVCLTETGAGGAVNQQGEATAGPAAANPFAALFGGNVNVPLSSAGVPAPSGGDRGLASTEAFAQQLGAIFNQVWVALSTLNTSLQPLARHGHSLIRAGNSNSP